MVLVTKIVVTVRVMLSVLDRSHLAEPSRFAPRINISPCSTHESCKGPNNSLLPTHARQGVEGTISQGVRAFGMRRSRYVGHRKTHLQHVAIASAINVVRLVAWLRGDRPEKTRTSAFARLFSYMLPARDCGMSLCLLRPGIRLQRCLAGVIPQIQHASI